MYSMVLMAAMVPAGDTAAFGKHKGGCDGAGCTGAVVADSGCCGGGKGGFLGMRSGGGLFGKHKKSNGCDGGSCHGMPAYSCHGGNAGYNGGYAGCNGGHAGTPVYGPSAGCVGGGIVVPSTPTTPDMMPKTVETPKPKVETPKPKVETPKPND